MKKKKSGNKTARYYGSKGGNKTLEDKGEKHFSSIAKKRWDLYHGKICQNCGQERTHVEANNLPCETYVEITIKEKRVFPEHSYNVPVRKPRKLKDN